MTVHLVIPDQHAHPDFNNDRADWVGKLILDLKPDVVINLGDAADLPSLSLYDKGKASFHSRNYEKDIQAHLDFQDRMWYPMRKAKKKQPLRVVLEGNHEHRIKRALELDPHLEGESFGISFKSLAFDDYYHEVVNYSGQTPGVIVVDGVTYAHYLVSGVMGRPVGGEHHASSLVSKFHTSCTVGHNHTVDWSVRSSVNGKKVMGMVAGVYQDYQAPWAGSTTTFWWSGVVIKRGVEDGSYSPQFVSIAELRKEYGQN